VSNSTTLANMRVRARRAADMDQTQFVTDNEVNDWVNASLSELHDIMVMSFEDYYEKELTINVIAGQDTYLLPLDFLKAQGVDANVGGITYSVPRYMASERNVYKSFPGTAFGGVLGMYYRIVGNELRFIPTPVATVATLRYIRQFQPLVTDTDLVDQVIPQGWEEYSVVDVAARMAIKEESDAGPFIQQKESLSSRIMAAAETRDAQEPYRVTDVTSNGWWG